MAELSTSALLQHEYSSTNSDSAFPRKSLPTRELQSLPGSEYHDLRSSTFRVTPIPSDNVPKYAILLFSAVLAILIVSLASEGWMYCSSLTLKDGPEVATIEVGLFHICKENLQTDGTPLSNTCSDIQTWCNQRPGSNTICHGIQAIQAFIILGLVFSFVGIVLSFFYASKRNPCGPVPAYGTAFLALLVAVFGLLCLVLAPGIRDQLNAFYNTSCFKIYQSFYLALSAMLLAFLTFILLLFNLVRRRRLTSSH